MKRILIVDQVEPEEPRHTDSDVGISGKIAVDLESEEHGSEDQYCSGRFRGD